MNHAIFQRLLSVLSAAICCAALGTLDRHAGLAAAEVESATEFFERQVRPLLAEKCFSCHGKGQRKGKLSLDSRAALLVGGESGPAAVSGQPEASLLIEAIRYTGDIQMPPDARLSDREIAIVERWVALGLPWPEGDSPAGTTLRADGEITDADRQFWSLRPVIESPLPRVQLADWPQRPSDHFIRHRIEAEGLELVPAADRRTFLRRLSFDLRGLPPSEEDVAGYIGDDQPDADDRLVDRLLATPQYGERWARHWLDVARYGEDQAHTFQARLYPQGYRYRDWVVASLNQDLPIDRFFMEQIAGDLLPGEDRLERLPALGFFALGPVYYADAGCAPKAKSDEYDDRIDTLCRGLLGLTVSCARCHDHKFDPISMKDYYALAGVFASTEYAEAPLAPPEVVRAYDEGQATIKQAEQRLKDAEAEAARKTGESFAPQTAQYLVAAWRVQNRRKSDANLKVSSILEGLDLKEFLVERWLQFLASDTGRKSPVLAPWQELVASQDAGRDLTDDAATGEAVARVAEEVQSQLVTAIDARHAADLTYRQQLESLPTGERKPGKPALPGPVAGILKDFVDNRDAPLAIPKDRVEKLLSEEAKAQLATLKQEIEAHKKAAPPKYPFAHSVTEGQPANSKIHLRGNVRELGDEVPRRFLSVLSPAAPVPFEQGSGRLELAHAIVSRDNPLTWRVFVNRVWQQHFGRGIVGTPSNFGLLGERPTHPELLDYLAARFVASDWSLKKLHREILTSATYRSSSAINAFNQERDPDNRLLWRMQRRRLEMEAWRDAMLLVAGNLEPTVGGPSVNLNAGNNRRRTLYAAVSRHELNPVLRLFDFPDPNLTSERRSLTTVPMQQLFVLNSDFLTEQAQALVARLEREKLSDEEMRIDQLYRWVLGRVPMDQERQVVRAFLSRPRPAGVSDGDVKLSRWEQYAQALLSTNEFWYVD